MNEQTSPVLEEQNSYQQYKRMQSKTPKVVPSLGPKASVLCIAFFSFLSCSILTLLLMAVWPLKSQLMVVFSQRTGVLCSHAVSKQRAHGVD